MPLVGMSSSASTRENCTKIFLKTKNRAIIRPIILSSGYLSKGNGIRI